MEALAGGTDLLCFGEMGIGNTAVASAIYLALWGGEAADWVGPGTGVVGEALQNKINVVARTVKRLNGEKDPLEILRRIGGREIAAMVGAILGARHQKVPVVLDGFVTTAAAAIVWAMNPDAIDHCIFAHCSAEPAHRRVLEKTLNAVTFIPRAEARAGDRVREVGLYARISDMPRVTRLDRAGLFVDDGIGMRLVPFAQIGAIVRVAGAMQR